MAENRSTVECPVGAGLDTGGAVGHSTEGGSQTAPLGHSVPGSGMNVETPGEVLYNTLVADPPWKFGDKLPGPKRGASKHYRTLTLDEIKRFPLPPLSANSRLFMWRVASMQEEALAVMKWWGFVLKSELVWRKVSKLGKRHMGMGRQVRMEHEVCLIGVRGSPPTLSRSIRSVFDAPVGRHSEKPDEFYSIVEALSPGPICELFARKVRPGWACFGDELSI